MSITTTEDLTTDQLYDKLDEMSRQITLLKESLLHHIECEYYEEYLKNKAEEYIQEELNWAKYNEWKEKQLEKDPFIMPETSYDSSESD